MSRIRILPEAVANKIAAGEVVERPASVVKELLENALDAGAKTIRVETESGGRRMIRVIDDGHGMTHDDALLAFERHATSKLRTAHDLLSIATLSIIDCPPAEKLADRVYQLFGRQALDELVELPPVSAPFRSAITEPALDAEEEKATLTISGFTSRPEVQRTNSSGIYIFVNKRLVRDKLILHAIHEAYRNIHPHAISPATLLFLEMPYDEVDVNVHPKKIEVRFRRSQFVHDFTRDTIRQALVNARPIASFAAAAAAPSSFGNSMPTAHGTTFSGGITPAPVESGIPRAMIPALEEVSIGSGVGSDGGYELSGAPLQPVAQRFTFESTGGFAPKAAPVAPPSAWAGNFAPANAAAPASLPHPDQIRDLKPLGQVSSSFIVAVNGEGLWIVDQHVAHERVLFEQHLAARRAGNVESQRMLMPLILELSPRQIVIFEKIAEEMSANGFEAEPMGPRSVAIQSVPAGVQTTDADKLLAEILDGLDRENAAISIETLQAKIAASTACHAAIKINMPLDHTKMEWLLDALAQTDCPMSCPHGRPVVLRYSVKEIERAFHRI